MGTDMDKLNIIRSEYHNQPSPTPYSPHCTHFPLTPPTPRRPPACPPPPAVFVSRPRAAAAPPDRLCCCSAVLLHSLGHR